VLYEDDFEFEEQPAGIRDRRIPGKNAPLRDRGARRRTGRGRRASVPEKAKAARDLLAEILERMGVRGAQISYLERPEGAYFEVEGDDLGMLIGKRGQTLEALNLVFNNILNLGVRHNRMYYTIDAEGYRAHRADRLRTLALETLERVVREGKPCKLDPMLPSERKIVHLALAASDHVRTESEGEEPERCVVVFPK
jgi:spoIIIJ-associated protein